MNIGDKIVVGNVTVTKTKEAQPMGLYKDTSVDAAKSVADFKITCVGNKNTIVWKDGKVELVTDAKLSKLQQKHTWTTDF